MLDATGTSVRVVPRLWKMPAVGSYSAIAFGPSSSGRCSDYAKPKRVFAGVD